MMQPSAGSQSKTTGNQPPGPQEFLSNFIADAVQKLQNQRNPSMFQQTANGAVAQTIDANPQNFA